MSGSLFLYSWVSRWNKDDQAKGERMESPWLSMVIITLYSTLYCTIRHCVIVGSRRPKTIILYHHEEQTSHFLILQVKTTVSSETSDVRKANFSSRFPSWASCPSLPHILKNWNDASCFAHVACLYSILNPCLSQYPLFSSSAISRIRCCIHTSHSSTDLLPYKRIIS